MVSVFAPYSWTARDTRAARNSPVEPVAKRRVRACGMKDFMMIGWRRGGGWYRVEVSKELWLWRIVKCQSQSQFKAKASQRQARLSSWVLLYCTILTHIYICWSHALFGSNRNLSASQSLSIIHVGTYTNIYQHLLNISMHWFIFI